MTRSEVGLRVKGFGAPPADARAEVAVLSRSERLKRAAAVLGAALAVALVGLPIPIVHFVLVPGALLLGVILAAVRLGQGEVFRAVEGRCPFCCTDQAFPVSGRFRLPRQVHCAHCHRALSLESAAG